MAKDVLGKDYSSIKNKKLFLFDMDGTIYLGNTLFDGVKELLHTITEKGGEYAFVTNNAAKSVKDYIKKLRSLGIETTKKNFFTSVQASIMVMKKLVGNGLIYAQGTKSFIKELKKNNLNVTTKYSEDAKAVLVAFDPEVTGKKLSNTCKMLKKDLPYYATNPDWVCPVEFGYIPDCGSMCFGIEKATGKTPIFIGKPQPAMILSAMENAGVTADETVVVGDRLYTDIASGVNAGVDTVLVLSGEATMKDYEESGVKSTYVLNSVGELINE